MSVCPSIVVQHILETRSLTETEAHDSARLAD